MQDQSPVSSAELIRPRFTSIRIEATGGCNCRCDYCFASDTMALRQTSNLSLDAIASVLDMARASSIRKVLFSGGEPLTRPDFTEMLRASYKLETSFVTNGSLLTDERLREYNTIRNLRRIRISIDGFSAHDAMRKGSSHVHVLSRIAAARQICPRLSITPHTTASPRALPEIPELLTELQRLGVDRWRLFMIRLGGGAASGVVQLSSTYVRAYVALLADIARRVCSGELTMQIEADGGYQSNRDVLLTKYSPPAYNNATHPCEYLVHVLMIRNNGDLSICPFFEFGLGNIRDFQSIAEIEESPKLIAWRNHRVEYVGPCSRCRYRRVCRSGCRKTSVELLGSFLAEDPLYCFMFPLLEEMLWPQLPTRTQAHLRGLVDERGAVPSWQDDGLDKLLQEYYTKEPA